MPTSDLIYSIPYLVVLSIFLFCALWEYRVDSNKNAIRLICSTTFLVFFGLRGFVGWDWSSYVPSFAALETIWGDSSSNFESISDFGFTFYTIVVASIWQNYHFFIFISVAIDFIVLNLVFKRYSPNYALSFAVFMVVSLGMEIDTLRNAKSIMILLLALPYIEDRKPFKFFALLTISILFHASAVLFIPIYFFLHRKISVKLVVTLFVVGNIVYLLQVPLIKPALSFVGNLAFGGRVGVMLDMYLADGVYSSSRGISISYLERLATSILVICYYNKLTSGGKSNIMFVNLFICYMVVALFMSEMSVVFARVGALFVISYWIIWPKLVDCFYIKNNRRIFLAWIILASLLLVTARSTSALYKYDNLITGIMDYQQRIIIFDQTGNELLGK